MGRRLLCVAFPSIVHITSLHFFVLSSPNRHRLRMEKALLMVVYKLLNVLFSLRHEFSLACLLPLHVSLFWCFSRSSSLEHLLRHISVILNLCVLRLCLFCWSCNNALILSSSRVTLCCVELTASTIGFIVSAMYFYKVLGLNFGVKRYSKSLLISKEIKNAPCALFSYISTREFLRTREKCGEARAEGSTMHE